MLEKQTISINLGLGLDTAKNDQAGDPSEFAELVDCVWNKEKQIEKRPGTEMLPATVSSSFSNPQTIGATSVFNSVAALGDQLLLQNKGAFYSYNDQADTWVQKGWLPPVEISTSNVVSGARTNYAGNSKRIGNFTIHVWQVATTNQLRYSFIENDTGNFIVDDALIENSGFCPQFFTTSVGTYLAYCGQAGYGIRVRSINATTGALSSATTVYATGTNNFNVQVLPASARGERIVFLAARNAGGAFDTVDMFAVDNTLAIDATLGTVALTAPRFQTVVCLYFDSAINNSRLFLAYQFSDQFGTRPTNRNNQAVAVYDIGASSWTVVLALTAVRSRFSMALDPGTDIFERESRLQNITAFTIPGTTNVRFLLQDQCVRIFTDVGRVLFPNIFDCIVSGSGTILQNSLPRYFGFTLLSKAVAYPALNTVLVAMGVAMPTQACEFVVDLYRESQPAPSLNIIAKHSYQKTVGQRAYKSLSDAELVNGVLYYNSANETRVANLDSSGLLRIEIDLFQTVLTYHKIELQKQKGQPKVIASDSLLIGGGYLADYDGADLVENNFHVAPDFIDVNYKFGSTRLISIDGGGLAGLTVGMNGAHFENNPQFLGFTFSSVTYRVYVYDESSGYVPPTGAWTNINVPISLGMSQNEIMFAILVGLSEGTTLSFGAINIANTLASFTSFSLSPTITGITNIVPPSTSSVPNLPVRYAAIYTYVDVHGKTHRSSPVFSPVFTPASGSDNQTGLVCYINQATAKNAASVQVEFYRTLGNGTVFYKLGALATDKKFSQSTTGRISFIDRIADNVLQFAEQLYTTGNVQENIGLGSVSAIANYKARVYAVTRDNPTAVYYSKSILDRVPIEFTPFNFITVNSTNKPITALAFLDDTLVIFKEEEIYLVAGDGANDIGTNASFSLPSALATDVGCIDPNTIEMIPSGITFMSKMGLHLLDRGRNVQYIGYPVEQFNTKNICRVVASKDNKESREIRVMMSDDTRALVYDYLMNKWGTFSQYSGQDATTWKGQFVRVNGSGRVFVERANTWTDVGSAVPSYNPVIETEWLNIKDQQDYQRIYRLMILGQLFTACDLKYQIYYDYDLTNFDSYTFSSSNITGSQPGDTVYQPQIHLKRQKCEAIKIRLEIDATGTNSERTLKLTDMAFQVGLKKGLNKVKAAKRL